MEKNRVCYSFKKYIYVILCLIIHSVLHYLYTGM